MARDEQSQHILDQQRELIEQLHLNGPRAYSRDEPVAADDRDPGNTDPEHLTDSLDPRDDVYTLVFQDHGDLRETAPMQDPSDHA